MQILDIRASRARAELALLAFVAGTVVVGARLAPDDRPLRPASDAVVLTRLPARIGPRARTQATAEERVRSARRELEAQRGDGDPRRLGRAEAWLAPLLEGARPATEALVLHATILQARHEFATALGVLDAVLERAPREPQALLLRAAITTVLGRPEEALASCAQLIVGPALSAGCRAPALALRGEAALALEEIATARQVERDAGRLAWLHSLEGELAYWYGDDTKRAREQLEQALALDTSDRYTRALAADAALDDGDRARARALTALAHDDDALLLRAVLAERGEAREALARELAGRFEASRMRGDRVHQREEARFRLSRGDVQGALALAREGFRAQREPWDARVLAEAARAAGASDDLAEIERWMRELGMRSPRLTRALGSEAER